MGSIPKVLALHSLGTDHQVWDEITKRWSFDMPFLAIDLPGHGARVFEKFSVDIAADFIIDFLEKEGPALLLGVSMGGPIALVVAYKRPELVSGLILMNTFAYQGEGGAQRVETAAKTINTLGLKVYAEEYAASVIYDQGNLEACRYITKAILRLGTEKYLEAAESVFTVDVRKEASALNKHALILTAENDQRVPEALSRDLWSMITGSRYEKIAASGHLSPLERPEAIINHIEKFLTVMSK